MAELPNKPTKIPANQVGQYVVEEYSPGQFRVKTSGISGAVEVDIDAQGGDNIAIADPTTGNKAEVIDNKLQVKDSGVIAKMQLKPMVDYDSVLMALSSGDTVETYTYKLSAATVRTLVVTYTDNTRQVWTSLVWS